MPVCIPMLPVVRFPGSAAPATGRVRPDVVPAPRGPAPARPRRRRAPMAVGAVLLVLVAALVAVSGFARPGAAACGPAWTTAWMASEQPVALPPGLARGGTLRMILTPQAAGSAVRVRLSNASGRSPLAIDDASVAVAGKGAALAGTPRRLTFGGAPSTVLPPGADLLSDPVDLDVAAGARLAVSVALPAPPPVVSGHAVALETSWLAGGADRVGETGGAAFGTSTTSWLVVTGLDVLTPRRVDAVVAVGDSITDGVGTAPDSAARWTDALAADLRGRQGMVVLNAGISGNTLLGPGPGAPPLRRYDRDVAAAAGVTDVVLNAGTNDIADGARAADLEAALAAYGDRARRAGKHVVLTTITPSTSGPHGTPAADATRDAVNTWVRTHGLEHADAVVDLAAALADPADPRRLASAFDSGDGLHPSAAGYRALATAVAASAELTGSPCLADRAGDR